MSRVDYVFVFAVLFLILGSTAVLATLWVKTVFAVLSVVFQTAYWIGFYRPEPRTRRETRTNELSERASLLLARVLQSISRSVPGDSNKHAHTWIVAVLLLGIPSSFIIAAVTIIAPVSVFWYAITAGPIPWSLLLGVLGVCVYFGLLATVWHVAKRVLVSV